MNYPPLLMNVRIRGENSRFGFFLPLPLFLIIPLALVIFIIVSPFILIGSIIFWYKGWRLWPFKAIWGAARCYCAMSGLRVDIRGQQAIVKISVV